MNQPVDKLSSASATRPRHEFFAGVRAEIPLIVGVIPFGLVYGVLAIAAGLPALQAQAMSTVVFAGASQFIATGLFATATPPLIILATTFVVNLRHLLYSASLAPSVAHLPLHWKAVLAYLLTDEAYAVTITHYEDRTNPLRYKHWFFLGAGLTLWTAWNISTAVGIVLGAQIPDSWSLDFALALTFIGIVVPGLKDRPHLVAAFVAGTTVMITYHWPYQLGLFAAALLGITAGMLAERHLRKSGGVTI